MFDFREAEQTALESGRDLVVNSEIFGIKVRFICTVEKGWVAPVMDISSALGISKQSQSSLLKSHEIEFAPFLTTVNLTLTNEQSGSVKLKCLTRDGITMYLMKLTPSRMSDPNVGKRISDFQIFVVKTFGEYLDYVKIPQWWLRREAAKLRYLPMTDAIKDHLLENVPKEKQWLVYASEADMLNVIVFNKTAKEAGGNQRDSASNDQLELLAKLQEINEGLIRATLDKVLRYDMLCKIRDDMIAHNRLYLPEAPSKQFNPYINY